MSDLNLIILPKLNIYRIYLKILIFESLEDKTNKEKYFNLLFEKYPMSDYALILKRFDHLIRFKM